MKDKLPVTNSDEHGVYTNFKTLKDMKNTDEETFRICCCGSTKESHGLNYIDEDKLKQEAINDIKFLETVPEDLEEFDKKEDEGVNYFCIFDAMASHDNSNVVAYIKWKNNLTEEDLK